MNLRPSGYEPDELPTAPPRVMVGGIGFEPMKAKPADLQSAPFNHSGIRPHGAGNRTRTYDLLITNQLLYQLSYVSTSVTKIIIHIDYFLVKIKVCFCPISFM